jgi:hypothetical protein
MKQNSFFSIVLGLSRCGPIDKALELLQLQLELLQLQDNIKDEATAAASDMSGGGDRQQLPSLGVTKYITKTFPLSQVDEAIRCAAEKSTMKVQIICSSRRTSKGINGGGI